MSPTRRLAILLIAAAPLVAAAAPPPAYEFGAPAPAVEAGGVVTDRNGVVVGPIRNVIEDASGEMHVVVQVDGKLVTISERALDWDGVNAVSTKTKAQILADAGAGPRSPMAAHRGAR